METTTLRAEIREPKTPTGRALRREGRVPGVYYNSKHDVRYLRFDALDLQRLLKSNFAVLELVVGDEKLPCVIREVQRHPVRGDIVHIDLFGVQSDQKIKLTVPVHIIGSARGVKDEGGTLDVTVHDLEVECLPGNLPNFLEVDVTALGTNEGLRVSDLVFEGVEIVADPQTTVVHVLPPRVQEEPTEAEAEAEAAEAAEPEVITEKKDEEEKE